MRVAGVILAAGAGRRLGGRCKAALRLPDGTTFLAAVAAAARAGGAAELVAVVGPPHAEAAREAARAAGVAVIENPAPERGMLSSLLVGLAGLDADAALVWPVNHPFVLPATVAAVVAASARARIVVPVAGGRGGHPTSFGADLWPELAASATARDVVARDPARVLRLAVDDPGVVRDVDGP